MATFISCGDNWTALTLAMVAGLLAPAAGMAAPMAIGNGTLSRLQRRTHTRELVDTEKF